MVVLVGHLATVCEPCIRLVEEEHGLLATSLVEQLLEVLLGPTHPARQHGGHGAGEQGTSELAGDHLGAEGLAGAGLALEQGRDALAIAQVLTDTPTTENTLLIAGRVDDLLDMTAQGLVEGDIAQPCGGNAQGLSVGIGDVYALVRGGLDGVCCSLLLLAAPPTTSTCCEFAS